MRLSDGSDLVPQCVGKEAPSQVALPEALDVGCGISKLPRAAVPGVGVDQRDPQAQDIPHVSHRPGEVGVVGHDDGLLVLSVESVDQQTGGEVDVRSLLLRVPGPGREWAARAPAPPADGA